MPELTIQSEKTVTVAADKRLVLAIEEDAGIDIMHACGGNARCTTCRVRFLAGEPDAMTQAEKEKLSEKGLEGVRLSCQILCSGDMTVEPLQRLRDTGRPDAGSKPQPQITPEPVWS